MHHVNRRARRALLAPAALNAFSLAKLAHYVADHTRRRAAAINRLTPQARILLFISRNAR